jgi:hypothetical protein
MSPGSVVDLGPLRIAFNADPTSWPGTPAAGGEPQIGKAYGARVTGPSGVALDVAVIQWASSRDVAATDCYGSPPRIRREWMQLRISRMTHGDWSSEYQTSVAELESVTHLPVAQILAGVGGTGVGSRGALFGEIGKQRNELALTFSAGGLKTPVVAYCVVRLLPLLYGHGQELATRAG